MRLNQVDLNLFIVFETIYAERNLTRAAEILCLSQPAVSNALARLRRMFDDPLFIRSKRAMAPTAVAENIIGRIRDALLLMNSSLNEGRVFEPKKSDKTFRINMSDLIAAMILPALEEAVTDRARGINLESYHIPRSELIRELATGAMDFVIDAPVLNDPQLCHAPLFKERYVCLLRKDHPFAGDKLRLEDYLGFDHIHVSSRRSGQGHVDIALNNMGHKRHIHLRLQHYMVAPLVALRSDMALTAPLGLLRQYDARIMELPFELPQMELHLYWHKSRDADQASLWMRQRIMDITNL
ncbi:MAG: LysR family transcriptional regulator [Alphaproteobacteria bacterium]|nr:MAG: LysR family transcriptional regulator [Alphaproteobacteria bacterium]